MPRKLLTIVTWMLCIVLVMNAAVVIKLNSVVIKLNGIIQVSKHLDYYNKSGSTTYTTIHGFEDAVTWLVWVSAFFSWLSGLIVGTIITHPSSPALSSGEEKSLTGGGGGRRFSYGTTT